MLGKGKGLEKTPKAGEKGVAAAKARNKEDFCTEGTEETVFYCAVKKSSRAWGQAMLEAKEKELEVQDCVLILGGRR